MEKLNQNESDNLEHSKFDSTEEWDLLPEYQRERIMKALAEADAGLGTPAIEVIQRVREKYGF